MAISKVSYWEGKGGWGGGVGEALRLSTSKKFETYIITSTVKIGYTPQ